MEEVPVIELDHLTDEQRRAYALAHNKTAELSGWDFNVLNDELEAVTDYDMREFGFFEKIILEDKEEKEKRDHEPRKCICPRCGAEVV